MFGDKKGVDVRVDQGCCKKNSIVWNGRLFFIARTKLLVNHSSESAAVSQALCLDLHFTR
jgi:hypothetical protein